MRVPYTAASVPSWVKAALDRWAVAAGIDSGPVLRRVDKAGRVGPGPLGAQSIFETVTAYGRQTGAGKITPHDLRRTFANAAPHVLSSPVLSRPGST